MRVAYYGPGHSTHDRRWVNALAATGWETFLLRTDQEQTPGSSPGRVFEYQIPDDDTQALESLLEHERIDLLVAGPLHRHAWHSARSGFQPYIALSWGSDILRDAKQDSDVSDRVAIALAIAAGVVVDCAAVSDAVSGYRRFADDAVLKIPWGVEPDQQHYDGLPLNLRGRAGWPDDSEVVLTNRTFAPLYRVDLVIKAFSRAFERNNSLRLVVLGDGPLAGELLALVDALAMRDYIHFVGRVPEAMMAAYLNEAGIYVSAAESDGSSVSLMQALWAGLPVVVTDIPSNAEWINREENGWLFPCGDEHCLAEMIVHVASLPAGRREAIAVMNQALARERADWNVHASSFRNFCEHIVARHHDH